MTWLPKSVVCLSYYDRFRFRSDGFAALVLTLQTFPLAIAIAVASEADGPSLASKSPIFLASGRKSPPIQSPGAR